MCPNTQGEGFPLADNIPTGSTLNGYTILAHDCLLPCAVTILAHTVNKALMAAEIVYITRSMRGYSTTLSSPSPSICLPYLCRLVLGWGGYHVVMGTPTQTPNLCPLMFTYENWDHYKVSSFSGNVSSDITVIQVVQSGGSVRLVAVGERGMRWSTWDCQHPLMWRRRWSKLLLMFQRQTTTFRWYTFLKVDTYVHNF